MDPIRPLLRLLDPLWSSRRWPALRLVLLLLHVFAVVAVACPAPVKPASKKQWEKPSVKVEIRGWHQRLQKVGVDVTERELTDWAFDTSREWTSARATVIKPFAGYLRTIGAPQGWYMFTAPDRLPTRFALDMLHDDGTTERVFTLGKPGGRPDLIDPAFLGEHRVRRALFQTSWSERPNMYKDVCTWFEHRLEERVPDLKEVSCTQIQFQVEHPWKDDKKAPDKVTRTVRVVRRAGDAARATTESKQ
ncbi:MAG: hypothetical protein Q8O67_16515 [Deltaproteobacteria bacterium]|nr:hypothetical protein [Deltaproteobacteria bacterium]